MSIILVNPSKKIIFISSVGGQAGPVISDTEIKSGACEVTERDLDISLHTARKKAILKILSKIMTD